VGPFPELALRARLYKTFSKKVFLGRNLSGQKAFHRASKKQRLSFSCLDQEQTPPPLQTGQDGQMTMSWSRGYRAHCSTLTVPANCGANPKILGDSDVLLVTGWLRHPDTDSARATATGALGDYQPD